MRGESVASDVMWAPRHSMVLLSYDAKLWIIGGTFLLLESIP